MFFNKKGKFNKKINSHIKSMVEICFEYVGWNDKETDTIYVFCSTEESNVFEFFYSIKGNIVKKHKVNDFLIQKCNVELAQQISVLKIGMADLLAIIDLFEKDKREIPTVIKITYDTHTSKINTDFSYNKWLANTDLTSDDLLNEWIEQLETT